MFLKSVVIIIEKYDLKLKKSLWFSDRAAFLSEKIKDAVFMHTKEQACVILCGKCMYLEKGNYFELGTKA